MLTNYNADFLTLADIKKLPFADCGCNVLIDSSTHLIGLENIRLGNNVRIDAGTIIVASGPVVIGSRVHIGANSYLEGRGGIRIEDFANVASYVSLHSVSDDSSGFSLTNPLTPEKYKNLIVAELFIGRHAVIFTKSTLLPGTVVGEGAVVGAHSLASGKLEPWGIYAGVPAQFKKMRRQDLLALEKQLLRESQP